MKRTQTFHEILHEFSQKHSHLETHTTLTKPIYVDYKSQIPLVDLLDFKLDQIIEKHAHNQYNQWKEQFPLENREFYEEHVPVKNQKTPSENEPQVFIKDLTASAQLAIEQLIRRGAKELNSDRISERLLKKSYRSLARALHPDLNNGKPEYVALFHAMHEEYELIDEALNEYLMNLSVADSSRHQ